MRTFMFVLAFAVAPGAAFTSAPTPIAADAPQASPTPTAQWVRIDRSAPIQVVRPLLALGSTVDKEPAGAIPALYSRENVREMLDAGYGWLSYRLFTELSVQDWHWNPAGRFSQGNEGYWTSSAVPGPHPISDSYGYRLPDRGFTTDQGNNEDYSRIDDGDPNTYWKSNPYLTRHFTGDPDSEHPQWIIVDLGNPHNVNAVRIDWSSPYATQFQIEYWTGDDAINDPGTGEWQLFPLGTVTRATGGQNLVRLSPVPIPVRFVRVLMTQSSNTCDSHGGSDIRNCVGYVVNEIYLGLVNAKGRFTDYVRHSPCGGEQPKKYACGWRQTATYVSSVDPWHTSATRVRNQEQPGLDLIELTGLTRHLGAMFPVPMLYSTPQNAVNEVRYLKARGYDIEFVELGEEPDGQYTAPEDDAALYAQWARAIHAVDPSLKLGGPVFSGVNTELETWPDASGNISWLNRFLNYLKSHNGMSELAFMSFEHYPFGGCDEGALLHSDLLQEPSVMEGIVNQWHSDGLPASVPLFITEANFSAVNFTPVPMQIEGALWQADYMASALANGVRKVVYYQYEPVPLSRNSGCPQQWGNLTMFVADRNARISSRAAQFWAAQMLTKYWLYPPNETFTLYPGTTNVRESGLPLVTAYAAQRSDNTWSVLFINKDIKPHTIDLEFPWVHGAYFGWDFLAGAVQQITFGPAQYAWHAEGVNSKPKPDHPPARTTVNEYFRPCGPSRRSPYTLPAQSLVVVQGRLEVLPTTCG